MLSYYLYLSIVDAFFSIRFLQKLTSVFDKESVPFCFKRCAFRNILVLFKNMISSIYYLTAGIILVYYHSS